MSEIYNMVTETIGMEYKDWTVNDIIFISAPTGTGKSSFIMQTLVRHALSQNRRIIYFVNRTILKQQLTKELSIVERDLRIEGFTGRLSDYFLIMTYQSLEKNIKQSAYNANEKQRLSYLCSNTYIVMDEAHYFLSDSTFNPSTELSFNYLMGYGQFMNQPGTIRILMSATGERVYDYIRRLNEEQLEALCRINVAARSYSHGRYKMFPYVITLKERYRDLKIRLFDGYKELADIICNGSKDKWLIFVDNKVQGDKLCQAIEDKGVNSISISARYKSDPEKREAVETIIEEERCEEQVCIMTYVLDNGVSIADDRRCIAIFADNKEQFLQCLGRNRAKDYADTYLYIPKGSVSSITNRRLQIERVFQFIRCVLDRLEETRQYNVLQYVCEVLDEICDSEFSYEAFKRSCYTFYGCVYKSRLSVEQHDYLSKQYDELKSDLEKDEWAFVRLQLMWLNREEDADRIIKEHIEGKILPLKRTILKYLEDAAINGASQYKSSDDPDYNILQDYYDEEFTNKKGMPPKTVSKWYNALRKDLYELFKLTKEEEGLSFWESENEFKEAEKSLRSDAPKEGTSGQIIGKKVFNQVMRFLKLPYTMGMYNQKTDKNTGDSIPNMRWIEKVPELEIEYDAD